MRLRAVVLLPCIAACTFQERPTRVVELRPADPGLRSLFWMEGTWVTDRGEDRVEEEWGESESDLMSGANRVIRGGDTVFSEQLRIERREAGIYYLATPEGQETTSFEMVQMSPARVVFENPAHDFPNRIIYWLSMDGRLHARVEAMDGSRAQQWDWVPADR